MLIMAPEHLKQIEETGERAYPREGCGFLVGRVEAMAGGQQWIVERVVESQNLAPPERRDRFEADFRLRLALQRDLRGSGRAIIGIYHSHPDGKARPSSVDLEHAWESDLVWVITAVAGGCAGETTAHVLHADCAAFCEIDVKLRPADAPLPGPGPKKT